MGFKDYELAQWHGVAIKSGTPKEITDRLNKEMREILAAPELRKLIETIGAENGAGAPDEWGAFYTADISKWAALMKQLNIKSERWEPASANPALVSALRAHIGHCGSAADRLKPDI